MAATTLPGRASVARKPAEGEEHRDRRHGPARDYGARPRLVRLANNDVPEAEQAMISDGEGHAQPVEVDRKTDKSKGMRTYSETLASGA